MKKAAVPSILVVVVLLAVAVIAEAQQAGKIHRIGFLDESTAAGSAVLLEAFRQELTKLGWIEGKNIIVEYRFGETKGSERLLELAADLVRLKVDLIVVSATGPTLAAKSATTTIPIVMTRVGDPVGEGLVASLAQPGGNVTGLSTLATELNTKRLEILKDAVPKLARVGVLRGPGGGIGDISTDLQLKKLRTAAVVLKLELEVIKTQRDPKGLESAFQSAKQKQVDAIMTLPLPPFSPKESVSSILQINIDCLLFTFRRSSSTKAVSCRTARTTMTCSDVRLSTWTRS